MQARAQPENGVCAKLARTGEREMERRDIADWQSVSCGKITAHAEGHPAKQQIANLRYEDLQSAP
ncbi:MAG TPA: hypothetical protein VN761_10820 [Candidatus Polarisedimenticolia bacterium]|nr:hypothetical protein [Candidatus Polarisedimenticolia bacterium]